MKTSTSQYQLMVNFMERNTDISKFETDWSSNKWGELTRKLNVDTTGEQKTVVAWKKVWRDLKKKAKRKTARINKENVSVGGSQRRSPLSELEQRVMSVLRPPGAAGLSAAPKIKLEVPEVQMASPAEELISSNCSPSYGTVQSHHSATPQTQNSDVQSRLQNSDVPWKLMKIELPLSPIASEMQIVPFQPKRENIRAANPSCVARPRASRRRRYCPYTRQAPPPLMCERVWCENVQLGHFNEYLRLWSWQLRQNERFLNIYRNKY